MKATIDEAKRLNDLGGDWDRRNRLKVYEAHYLMSVHDLKGAAALLLDCVATFSCTELCTYNQFMFYALVTNVIFLGRTTLREKVINDPFVITVARELPNAQALVHTIYNCQYKEFFETVSLPFTLLIAGFTLRSRSSLFCQRLIRIASLVLPPPFCSENIESWRMRSFWSLTKGAIGPHISLLNCNFLFSSVMLSSMASSFGISVSLLDSELSRFIAAGRLNAKIDKVGDIVETRRPDRKNAQYQDVIKKGDLLLNQIQKLVRAIDV